MNCPSDSEPHDQEGTILGAAEDPRHPGGQDVEDVGNVKTKEDGVGDCSGISRGNLTGMELTGVSLSGKDDVAHSVERNSNSTSGIPAIKQKCAMDSSADRSDKGVLYQCKFCEKEFRSQRCFLHHKKTHYTGSRGVKNKSLNRKSHFKSHIFQDCNKETHKCPIYNKFLPESKVQNHIQNHSSSRHSELHSGVQYPNTDRTESQSIEDGKKVDSVEGPDVSGGSMEAPDQYVCLVCKNYRHFEFKYQLDWHTQHHETRSYKCYICSEKYLYRRDLEDHTFVHFDETPYKCHYCTKGYRNRNKFMKHLKTHIGAWNGYRCSLCTKSFSNKYNLKRHLKSHFLNQRVFSCRDCQKTFQDVDDLVLHIMTHCTEQLRKKNKNERTALKTRLTGVKAPSLDEVKVIFDGAVREVCSRISKSKFAHKKFTGVGLSGTRNVAHSVKRNPDDGGGVSASKQKCAVDTRVKHNHKVLHQQKFCEKEYCTKGYRNRKKFLDHLKTHIGAWNGYRCSLCTKNFSSKYNLKRHLKTHFLNQKVFSCSDCQKAFQNVDDLVLHIMTHCTEQLRKKNKKERTALKTRLHSVKAPSLDEVKVICDRDVKVVCSRISKSKFACKKLTGVALPAEHNVAHSVKRNPDDGGGLFASKRKCAMDTMVSHDHKEVLHPCKFCKKEFKSERCFVRHMKTHSIVSHGVKIETLKRKTQFKSRIIQDCNKKLFKCLICNNEFLSESKLESHVQNHSSLTETELDSGAQHPNIDHSESQSVGDDKNVDSVEGLDIISGGSLEEPDQYKCLICKNYQHFKFKYQLDWHMQFHETRSYKCYVCSKIYLQRKDLEDHTFVHFDEIPYKCHYCTKVYRNRHKFWDHLRTHTATWNCFRCSMCTKSFVAKCYLKIHLKYHFVNQEVFSCRGCQKTFQNIDDLVLHIMTHCTDHPRKKNKKERTAPNTRLHGIEAPSLDEVKVIYDGAVREVCSRISKSKFAYKKLTGVALSGADNVAHSVKRNPDDGGGVSESNQMSAVDTGVDHNHKEVLHPCKFCEKEFKSERCFARHMKTHSTVSHGVKIETFKTNIQFKSRINQDSNKEILKCSICNNDFLSKCKLESHMQNHSPLTHCDLDSAVQHPNTDHTEHQSIGDNLNVDSAGPDNTSGGSVEEKYLCHICTNNFELKYQLDWHIQNHKIGSYDCHICIKKYYNRTDLEDHIFVHLNETPYKCPYCTAVYRHRSSFWNHLKTHTGNGYKCRLCTKSFAIRSRLKVHIMVHFFNEKVFSCHDCKKTFKNIEVLVHHILDHHTDQPLGESKEEMTSATKDMLNGVGTPSLDEVRLVYDGAIREVSLRMSKGNFVCKKLTGVSLSAPDNVTHSVKRNPDDRGGVSATKEKCAVDTGVGHDHKGVSFRCKFCDKEFRSGKCFLRHKKTHSAVSRGVKNKTSKRKSLALKCPICNNKFLSKRKLESHMQIHFSLRDTELDIEGQHPNIDHTESKSIGEDKNAESVKGPDIMSRGSKGQSYTCLICKKILHFEFKYQMDWHIHYHETRSYKCSVCNKKHSRRRELEDHTIVHFNETPYKCHYCTRVYSQRYKYWSHLRTHTRTLNYYRCSLCTKNFSNKYNLMRHLKSHFLNQKVFSCSDCQKTFQNVDDLVLHIMTHCTEQPRKKNRIERTAPKTRLHGAETPSLNEVKVIYDGAVKEVCLKISKSKFAVKKLTGVVLSGADNVAHSVKRNPDGGDGVSASKQKCSVDTWVDHNHEEVLHRCKSCEKEFKSETCFVRHMKTHSIVSHGVKIETFKRKTQFKSCINQDSNKEIFKCSICNNEFLSKCEFQCHMQNHSSLTQCELDSVVQHRNIDHTESQSVGDNQNFYSAEGPDSMSEGYVKEPYMCHICTEVFEFNYQLDWHLHHHKTGSYNCHICSKKSWNSKYLEDHIFVHINETPYRCHYCSTVFKCRFSFWNHLKAHTENWIGYRCSLCTKSFGIRSNLKRHLKVHFVNQKVYSCCDCQKTFQNIDVLLQHIMSHHTDQPQNKNKEGMTSTSKDALNDVRSPSLDEVKLVYDRAVREVPLRISKDNLLGKKVTGVSLSGADNVAHSVKRNPEDRGGVSAAEQKCEVDTGIDHDHKGVLHRCKFCDKKFTSERCFLRHMKTHSRIRSPSLDEVKLVCDGAVREVPLRISKSNLVGENVTGVSLPGGDNAAHSVKRNPDDRGGVSATKQKCAVDTRVDHNHKEDLHQCKFCEKEFKSERCFLRHIKTHSTVSNGVKNRTVSKETHFKSRKIEDFTKEIFKCPICKKNFLSQCKLDSHVEKHSFLTQSKPDHLIRHSNIDQSEIGRNCKEDFHQCKICKKSFRSKGGLIYHMKSHSKQTHHGIKNIRLKTSHSKSRIIHDFNTKEHKCHVCNKEFSLKSMLVMHLRYHFLPAQSDNDSNITVDCAVQEKELSLGSKMKIEKTSCTEVNDSVQSRNIFPKGDIENEGANYVSVRTLGMGEKRPSDSCTILSNKSGSPTKSMLCHSSNPEDLKKGKKMVLVSLKNPSVHW